MIPKRIALIGAGRHSVTCHAPSLRQYASVFPDTILLHTVCDLDLSKAQKTAEEFGFIAAVDSINALFKDKENMPDAIVAVLPVSEILSVASLLLKYKLPLLVEKPLGRSINDARQFIEAVNDASAADRIMVSLNRRFDPSLTMANDWLKSQDTPKYVRVSMFRAGREEVDFVWNTGIHVIDALNYFWGPLKIVKKTCISNDKKWTVVDFQNHAGTIIHLEILPCCGEWEEKFCVYGKDYSLEIKDGSLPPWHIRAVKNMRLELDKSSSSDEPAFISNGTYGETKAFLDFVCGNCLLPFNVNQVFESSLLVHEIQL